MDIQIKGTDYEPTPEILERVQKKLAGLERHLKGEDDARAYVELGKAVGSHHTGAIWRAEYNLTIKGAVYRAESTRRSIEDALQKAGSEVVREVKNAYQRERRLVKRGGSRIKGFLRGFGA